MHWQQRLKHQADAEAEASNTPGNQTQKQNWQPNAEAEVTALANT
jgi:hypothetical protein